MADFEWLAPGGHKRLVDNVVGLLADKPDSDALSPLLTAGAANGITGDGPADSAAWLQRVSTADGPTTIHSIHGRTLRWNQLAPSFGNWNIKSGGTVTKSVSQDGRACQVTVTTDDTASVKSVYASGSFYTGHAYYLAATVDATNLPSSSALYGLYETSSPTAVGRVLVESGASGRYSTIVTVGASVPTELRCGFGTSAPNGSYATFSDCICIDITAMFGIGNEPTVEEFEALYPADYYPYDAGSLLPVNMEGIESTGFNQWDEEWEVGNLTDGVPTIATNTIRSKNFCECLPSTSYYLRTTKTDGGAQNRYYLAIAFYDADKQFIYRGWGNNQTVISPDNAAYFKICTNTSTVVYGAVYLNDICINLSDPTRNGQYEPYWHQERSITATDLRSAGAVYDELTATERITRVGVVDLGTLTWYVEGSWQESKGLSRYSAVLPDAANVQGVPNGETVNVSNYFEPNHAVVTSGMNKAYCITQYANKVYLTMPYPEFSGTTDFVTWLSTHPATLHYQVVPTTVEIDPPLNLSYRTEHGGTERVLVPAGENSAPPTIVAAQGYTAESLRDAALSAIAPVENGLASTNYGVGSYLVHCGQLCKVTTAIASGEAIAIGTNVVTTNVMAEILSLVQ